MECLLCGIDQDKLVCESCIQEEVFEKSANSFIEKEDGWSKKKQQIVYELLKYYYYVTFDLEKSENLAKLILDTQGLCYELYYKSIEHYARIAEYDFAEVKLEELEKAVLTKSGIDFLYIEREIALEDIGKYKITIEGYRTKKPYWPNRIENRLKFKKIYEEKGIVVPRITYKAVKVDENEFEAIEETEEYSIKNYCSFWCSKSLQVLKTKLPDDIYQIAAIRVRNDLIIDEFQCFIKPERKRDRKYILNQIGEETDIFLDAEDIDQVMTRFFAFVGEDVLVSTGALGSQGSLISRAARYNGMKRINNLFLDLLDYAAEVDNEFDMQNNNREFLLNYFGINEGNDSLEKAKKNVELFIKFKGVDQ